VRGNSKTWTSDTYDPEEEKVNYHDPENLGRLYQHPETVKYGLFGIRTLDIHGIK
jgi:hypothetical protein